MTLIKKFLLIIILIITFFVLYRLYLQRIVLLEEGFREGYTDSIDSQNEYEALTNAIPLPPSIANFNCPPSMTIKDLAIKASYNTAYTGGSYMNTNMIKFVMSRGCRFLDFEIYNYTDINGQILPVVAKSSQPDTIDTLNNIPLTDALTAIDETAFSIDTGDLSVPNPADPLFIHLRIQNVDNNGFYSSINNILGAAFGDKMYNRSISKSTLMSEIMGKYVVLIDKTSRGYMEDNGGSIITNKNGETGGTDFMLYHNSNILSGCNNPPIVETQSMTNVQDYKIVLADKGTSFWGWDTNPNINILLDQYGSQIVACKYWAYDTNLIHCEAMFGHFQTAITLLANAIAYVRNPDVDEV